MIAAERHARDERLQLRESMLPILDKLGRGERLSFEQRKSLDATNKRMTELEREIRDHEQARGLSAASAAQDFSAPDFDRSDSVGSDERAFELWARRGITSPGLVEMRAAGEATNSAGGFLVPPGWWQRLQVALKAYGGTAADFQPLETDTGQPMTWATNDPTNVIGSQVDENTQISDVDFTFGQGVFSAYLYTSGVHKTSLQLAQDSAFDIGEFITARTGEALGRAIAAKAIAGTGSSQPLGIIPALNAKGAVGSGSGGFLGLTASTGVNVHGTSGTAPAGTNYVQTTELLAQALAPQTVNKVIASVDRAYRALGAKWYFNDAMLQGMRNVVDGFGRPLYTEILDDVNPMLRGYPVVVDNNVPSLAASTTGGPIFGHLASAMTYRTVKGAGLMRLEERYADFLQVGWIAHMRVDIRSNDTRAAVTVKPSTA